MLNPDVQKLHAFRAKLAASAVDRSMPVLEDVVIERAPLPLELDDDAFKALPLVDQKRHNDQHAEQVRRAKRISAGIQETRQALAALRQSGGTAGFPYLDEPHLSLYHKARLLRHEDVALLRRSGFTLPPLVHEVLAGPPQTLLQAARGRPLLGAVRSSRGSTPEDAGGLS